MNALKKNPVRTGWTLLACLFVLGGCKSEEAKPAPEPAPKAVAAFDIQAKALSDYSAWDATGKEVAAARDYLEKNPKAADAIEVAGKAAKVTLDAAVVSLLSGGESAVKGLGLEVVDGNVGAAAGASLVDLMTDRLGVENRDDILAFARALQGAGSERTKALNDIVTSNGPFATRARALLMQEMQPALAKLLDQETTEKQLVTIEGELKRALTLLETKVDESDPLRGLLKKEADALAKSADVHLSFPLAGDGEDTATGKPAETPDGPAWSAAPIEVIRITEQGAAVSFRPTLTVTEGTVKSASSDARKANAPVSLAMQDLLRRVEPKPAEEGGNAEDQIDRKPDEKSGFELMAEELARARSETAPLYEQEFSGAVQNPEDKPAQTYLKVDGAVQSSAVAAVSEAAEDAGFGFARWVTGPNPRDYIVVGLGESADLDEVAPAHFERSLLLHVKKDGSTFILLESGKREWLKKQKRMLCQYRR